MFFLVLTGEDVTYSLSTSIIIKSYGHQGYAEILPKYLKSKLTVLMLGILRMEI